jgi:hypothetical protein
MPMSDKLRDILGKEIKICQNVSSESSIGSDIILMNMLVMKSDWSLLH